MKKIIFFIVFLMVSLSVVAAPVSFLPVLGNVLYDTLKAALLLVACGFVGVLMFLRASNITVSMIRGRMSEQSEFRRKKKIVDRFEAKKKQKDLEVSTIDKYYGDVFGVKKISKISRDCEGNESAF